MKTILCTLVLILSTSFGENSLMAQGIGASDLSLTFGYSTSSFSYPIPESDFAYEYRSRLPSLYLQNKFLTFSLRYGVQESDSVNNLVNLKMLEGSISGGPVIPIIGPSTDLGISLYLPLRGILDYRFLNVIEDLDLDTPNLYFVEPSIGGGIGFGLRPTWLDSKVRLIGSIVHAFGLQKELGDQYPDNLRLLRKADFDIEVRVNNLLGNLGLAVGYSNRSIRWSSEAAEDFDEPVEFITKRSRLPEWVSQKMIRFGVVWHSRKGN